ncbi:MAG: hypothetical protein RLZZ450_331 [Pseudomonadota bacterium]|jgi:cytochrome c peroxidase
MAVQFQALVACVLGATLMVACGEPSVDAADADASAVAVVDASAVAVVDASVDGGQVQADAQTADGAQLDGDAGDRALQFLLPEALPVAPGNKYADRDDVAMLGLGLFFDTGLGNGGCPRCHLPELAFTDRKPISMGKGVGTRNAPTTFNAARLSVFFWDGHADSLWSQPVFAIESALEMDSSRLALAHHLREDLTLRPKYEAIFGDLPDMSLWPRAGKPGEPAFDTLDAATQTEVNRVAANVGKALEAYERKNATTRGPIDRFLLGDTSQLSSVSQDGLELFLTQHCDSCHGGPMLTDEDFHDVGFPDLAGAVLERVDARAVLERNPFNLLGLYADAPPSQPAWLHRPETPLKAFRTPSLRNVARTAPYGHNGALATLRDVLAVHAPGLSSDEHGALIAFMSSLNGDYPPLPWSSWPVPQ